jgi:hypothetical protein
MGGSLQMPTTFFARVVLPLAMAGAAFVSMSETSFAGSGTGKITLYDLNSSVPGRGACVLTTPALPNTGYACVESPGLFKELDELLLQAYLNGKTCSIFWFTTDVDGYFIITDVNCS